MIFVPQRTDSIVDITTNSSSEIFVFDKNLDIISIDKIIEEKNWRWWFGELKKIKDILEANEFIKKYDHVINRLFPNQFPNFPCRYNILYENRMYFDKIFVENVNKFKQLNEDRDRLYRTKRNNGALPEEIFELIRKNEKEEDEVSEQLLKDWIKLSDLSILIGIHYYECGEDNELRDWNEVHDTIPGNYARLS